MELRSSETFAYREERGSSWMASAKALGEMGWASEDIVGSSGVSFEMKSVGDLDYMNGSKRYIVRSL